MYKRQEDERDRLRMLVETLQPDAARGVIVRTAAEGISVEALQADLAYLMKLWGMITSGTTAQSGSPLVHADLPLAVRVVRDLTNHQIERVRVDSEE